ncbi:MAG: PilZ domain-containing protein [Spirochaetales bacterium]|nr:PilZ domain-containing protein [Spirochaetales bacterium]
MKFINKMITILVDYNETISNLINSKLYYKADSIEDSILFNLECNNVDSYIINCNNQDITHWIEKIRYLNSYIPIALINSDKTNKKEFKNLYILKKAEDYMNFFTKIPDDQRDANRLNWPLKVNFNFDSESSSTSIGLVLSLSITGCYMKISGCENPSEGDICYMDFSFNEYLFYAEGRIVRCDKDGSGFVSGVGLEFVNVSPQTIKILNNIINEKILSEIMSEIGKGI